MKYIPEVKDVMDRQIVREEDLVGCRIARIVCDGSVQVIAFDDGSFAVYSCTSFYGDDEIEFDTGYVDFDSRELVILVTLGLLTEGLFGRQQAADLKAARQAAEDRERNRYMVLKKKYG